MFVGCGAFIVRRFKFPQLLQKPDRLSDSNASKLLPERTLETRLYFGLKPGAFGLGRASMSSQTLILENSLQAE